MHALICMSLASVISQLGRCKPEGVRRQLVLSGTCLLHPTSSVEFNLRPEFPHLSGVPSTVDLFLIVFGKGFTSVL